MASRRLTLWVLICTPPFHLDAPQFGDGNCLVDNKTTPFTLSDQLSCPPHFYCPNINPRDAISFPSMCPPTLECQTSRLSAYFCQPQGKYEPIVGWHVSLCVW